MCHPSIGISHPMKRIRFPASPSDYRHDAARGGNLANWKPGTLGIRAARRVQGRGTAPESITRIGCVTRSKALKALQTEVPL